MYQLTLTWMLSWGIATFHEKNASDVNLSLNLEAGLPLVC